MQLTEIDFSQSTPIDGYGPGFFRVGGKRFDGPILVWPGTVTPWSGFEDQAELEALAGQIDVVFVGTGAEMAPIPAAFRDALEALGLGVEFMASPAACRTYNVLLSEGRRVALALLPL